MSEDECDIIRLQARAAPDTPHCYGATGRSDPTEIRQRSTRIFTRGIRSDLRVTKTAFLRMIQFDQYQIANVIFIDSPRGVGYSFQNKTENPSNEWSDELVIYLSYMKHSSLSE